MAEISNKISESLREYLILTGWVKSKAENVSLEAKLGDSIVLQYPYMTARMQCVVGPEMAVAAGRSGILTCIPRSLRDVDKQRILDANKKARLKKDDIEYIMEPSHVEPETSLEDTVNLVNKTGHSVIPIFDRFSKLSGFYIHDPDNLPLIPPYTPISEVMIPLGVKRNGRGVPFLHNNDGEEIKSVLSKGDRKFIPIVDNNMILQRLAFLQQFDTNYVGIAISTGNTWMEELEKWGPQVDTLMIDSSNACFDDSIRIIKAAKKKFPNKPFGIGNIIQGKHFETFADAGADYVICSMGVGSICKTGAERGNGRGQFTVAKEIAEARDDYTKKRYVPIVIDGGIGSIKDMTIALAFGDFIMMGNYFNRFYESAARKFSDDKGNETNEESRIHYVESWGEGHPRARLVSLFGMNLKEAFERANLKDVERVIERYGHSSLSNATVEGVVGIVEYRGRLKPCIENEARYRRVFGCLGSAWYRRHLGGSGDRDFRHSGSQLWRG